MSTRAWLAQIPILSAFDTKWKCYILLYAGGFCGNREKPRRIIEGPEEDFRIETRIVARMVARIVDRVVARIVVVVFVIGKCRAFF